MKTDPIDCAYPTNQSVNNCDGYFIGTVFHSGLTKREYFAALAMQGMLANSKEPDTNGFQAINKLHKRQFFRLTL